MVKSMNHYDRSLVQAFHSLMKKTEIVKSAAHKCDHGACMLKAVQLLEQACEVLENVDGTEKACKKIEKALKALGKIADLKGYVKEINSTEEIEKEVQEEIEEQSK
jgi:DNA-directed RNA polymerase subunit L